MLSILVIAAMVLFLFITAILLSGKKHLLPPEKGSTSKSGKDPTTIPGWTCVPAHKEYGDMLDIISKGGIHKYLQFHHEGGKCPIFAFTWRDKKIVSVCSPKAYRDMQKLTNRPGIIFKQYDCLHAPSSIQCINDEAWEERRAILHQTIKGQILGSFFPMIYRVARKLHERWSSHPSGTPIAIMCDLQEMNLMAILISCFTVDINDGTLKKIAAAYHHCKKETELRMLGDPDPQSKRELDFQINLKVLKDYILQMMEDRRNSPSEMELPCMDALLHSGYPKEQIVQDVLSFIGGYHTSAYYLTMLFWFLAQNDDIQEKIHDEIEKEVGDDHGDRLKHYALKSKTYLRHVLDEGLRIGMIANFSAHCSNEDEVISGYTIPAHTPILQALGVTMMDDSIWENPECFYPERFYEISSGPKFRPFGVPSKRKCPADQFTYFMGGMYITEILRDFTILVSSSEEVSQLYGLTSAPKGDVYIQVQSRMKT